VKCPFCESNKTIVKNSRDSDEGKIVRRRRECETCKNRFTTFESIQLKKTNVIKRSGFKKPLDRSKILKSISTAARKRNISNEEIDTITDRICLKLQNSNEKEISSKTIGQMIMQELAKIDQVAYIRFASVYKDFTNLNDFIKFINKLKK